MAVVNPHVHTEQEVLNSSFDETTGLLIVEGAEYVPDGSTKRKVTEDLAFIFDDYTTADTIYLGEATPGSAQGSAVWKIQKINTSAGMTFTWADSNANFDNVWTNRASLTYG